MSQQRNTNYALMSYSANKLTTATDNDGSQHSRPYQDDSIYRFLADRDQRPPIELGSVQTQEEAEAADAARMAEYLRAFGVHFSRGDDYPTAELKQRHE
jgi:hypothetical protein